MKKILIYGKGSYIGEHYKEGLQSAGHHVDMIDSMLQKPGEFSVLGYDVVINVVGIAHIKITQDMKDLFFKINTDYAVRLCEISKKQGVGQYIYMSSMNVYGDTSECIKSRDQEGPKNFYGESKLRADLLIHAMADENFKVASVRPPVVYGKGCKGNFNPLVKLARVACVFPKYNNVRSIIHIDNLTSFMCRLVEKGDGGFYHPQNDDYTSTTELVVAIRTALGKKTLLIPGFSWVIRLLMKFVGMADRAVSDDYYSKELSRYGDSSYCQVDFIESIGRTIR